MKVCVHVYAYIYIYNCTHIRVYSDFFIYTPTQREV